VHALETAFAATSFRHYDAHIGNAMLRVVDDADVRDRPWAFRCSSGWRAIAPDRHRNALVKLIDFGRSQLDQFKALAFEGARTDARPPAWYGRMPGEQLGSYVARRYLWAPRVFGAPRMPAYCGASEGSRSVDQRKFFANLYVYVDADCHRACAPDGSASGALLRKGFDRAGYARHMREFSARLVAGTVAKPILAEFRVAKAIRDYADGSAAEYASLLCAYADSLESADTFDGARNAFVSRVVAGSEAGQFSPIFAKKYGNPPRSAVAIRLARTVTEFLVTFLALDVPFDAPPLLESSSVEFEPLFAAHLARGGGGGRRTASSDDPATELSFSGGALSASDEPPPGCIVMARGHPLKALPDASACDYCGWSLYYGGELRASLHKPSRPSLFSRRRKKNGSGSGGGTSVDAVPRQLKFCSRTCELAHDGLIPTYYALERELSKPSSEPGSSVGRYSPPFYSLPSPRVAGCSSSPSLAAEIAIPPPFKVAVLGKPVVDGAVSSSSFFYAPTVPIQQQQQQQQRELHLVGSPENSASIVASSKRKPRCQVCGTRASVKCGGCGAAYFCGRDHFAQAWESGSHHHHHHHHR
jgi:hypothetical protein